MKYEIQEVKVSNLKRVFYRENRTDIWRVEGKLQDETEVVQFLMGSNPDPVVSVETTIKNLSRGSDDILTILGVVHDGDPLGSIDRFLESLTKAIFVSAYVDDNEYGENREKSSYWILKPLFDAIKLGKTEDNDTH